MTVNYYFVSSAKYLYEKNEDDFVLFLEDDLLYQENTFDVVLTLMNKNNNKDLIYSKMANNRDIKHFKGMRKYTRNCRQNYRIQYGYYGILRSFEQLRIFVSSMKFMGHVECGDAVSENLCISLSKNVSALEVARHFGRDKTIPQ